MLAGCQIQTRMLRLNRTYYLERDFLRKASIEVSLQKVWDLRPEDKISALFKHNRSSVHWEKVQAITHWGFFFLTLSRVQNSFGILLYKLRGIMLMACCSLDCKYRFPQAKDKCLFLVCHQYQQSHLKFGT